jgi:hypothetical protein
MSDILKEINPEKILTNPRKERKIHSIGRISVERAEQRLDDLHELSKLFEQMAQ